MQSPRAPVRGAVCTEGVGEVTQGQQIRGGLWVHECDGGCVGSAVLPAWAVLMHGVFRSCAWGQG